jgi:hypothetical protein
MTDTTANSDKTHYICQTYVEKASAAGQVSLQIDKQLQYSSESQAQDRADREFERGNCVGADAYMITEDAGSGEVSPPTFIVRHGTVPDIDDL